MKVLVTLTMEGRERSKQYPVSFVYSVNEYLQKMGLLQNKIDVTGDDESRTLEDIEEPWFLALHGLGISALKIEDTQTQRASYAFRKL